MGLHRCCAKVEAFNARMGPVREQSKVKKETCSMLKGQLLSDPYSPSNKENA